MQPRSKEANSIHARTTSFKNRKEAQKTTGVVTSHPTRNPGTKPKPSRRDQRAIKEGCWPSTTNRARKLKAEASKDGRRSGGKGGRGHHRCQKDLWDTLVVVAVITYLIGIVSGAVMLFASSTLLCGVCSVFFAGVAVTDVIIMVAWFHFADTLRALYIVLWMVPSIIGALACYEGSAKAFWVERD